MYLENLEWKYLAIGGAPIVQNPNKTYVLKVVNTEPEPVNTEPEPVKKWYQKIWERLKNLLYKWWKKKKCKKI